MADETGRVRFHYGFYAAMENEYDLKKIPLTYEQEVSNRHIHLSAVAMKLQVEQGYSNFLQNDKFRDTFLEQQCLNLLTFLSYFADACV